MNIQKRILIVTSIILFSILRLNTIQGQYSFSIHPDEIPEAVESIYQLYPNSVQIPAEMLSGFLNNAISNLPIDSSLPTPDTEITELNSTDFTLAWSGSPLVNQYNTGVIDLDLGLKETGITDTETFSSPFLGTGLNLIVVQAANSTNSSLADIIIVEKVVMLVETLNDISCYCKYSSQIEANAYAPIRQTYSYPIQLFSNCKKTLYKITITSIYDTVYKFTIGLVNENYQIAVIVSNECGDDLITHTTSDGSFLYLTDSEELFYIDFGSNQLLIKSVATQDIIQSINVSKCCKDRRNGGVSPEAFVINSDNQISNTTFEVYPNPAKDILSVHYLSSNNEQVHIKLISPQGRVLTQLKNAGYNGQHTHELDVSEFPDGIYYLSFQSKTKNHIEKVVLLK